MAEEIQNTPWPQPIFRFKVWLGDDNPAIFEEVSGLESDTTPYRRDDQRFQPQMPGQSRVNTVILHKGILARDSKFWAWYDKTQQNIIERRVLVIELFNDAGMSTMKWTIDGAWPTKVSAADAKSDGVEIAIDKLEFAFDSLTASTL